MGVGDELAVNVPVEEDVLVDENAKMIGVESGEVLGNGSVEMVDNSCRFAGAGA